MKYFNFMLCLIFAVALPFNAVSAQESADSMFDKYDAGQDDDWDMEDFTAYYNEVSVQQCAAAAAKAEENFKRFDADGDGFISYKEEGVNRLANHPTNRFQRGRPFQTSGVRTVLFFLSAW